MADGRARGRACPFPAFARSDEAVDVQRLGGHDEFLAPVGPGGTGPVSIYLDSEPVRVAQVQSFAHGMVGRTGTESQTEHVRRKTTERRSVGQEKGEVVQTESASSRDPRNTSLLDQVGKRRRTMYAKRGSTCSAFEHDHAEHIW